MLRLRVESDARSLGGLTMIVPRRARPAVAVFATCVAMVSSIAVAASPTCPEEQSTQQVPTDLSMCHSLLRAVQNPSQLPLDKYEAVLHQYLEGMCHRDLAAGWTVDKRVRDTGPWIGTYASGQWTGTYYGTHAPVLVWYSPEMYAWLKANRQEAKPEDRPVTSGLAPPLAPDAPPVPDGAIIVKEMYTPPAAACTAVNPLYLKATSKGAAIMVRDSKGAHDGWFWSGYGWGAPDPDWPAPAGNRLPYMGFGQYCTNCHASAKDNQTFASLKNIAGELGEPLVFLSQNFFLDPSWMTLQERIAQSGAPTANNDPDYDKAFTKLYWSLGGPPPRDQIVQMPSETYDNVWVKPGEPTAASQFVTSDQCLGCHSAGGTGLQFDMTEPGPGDKLINISPYGTWRGSPMGLAGRDPIFFAQLASETGTFHPQSKTMVEDTCLGCHGIDGQRQHAIDTKAKTGTCEPFSRENVNAIPWIPPITGIAKSPKETDAVTELANYGALARDGVSCTACHHMVLGKEAAAKYHSEPQNLCIDEKQKALNPHFQDFASSFTGAFLVGPPNELYGPFPDPKKKPMKHAMGVDPAENRHILHSEMCGTCHTVHLPVMHRGQQIGHVYEQTTYPEWAFSGFRTGDTPDGGLPRGGGGDPKSCQDCHMPNKDAFGKPYRSKIAAIQEYTSFPQAEHTLLPTDINLPERIGFGQHTLVGLNVYLLKMAWQFPDILGIRTKDPMLWDRGIDSIPTSEGQMLDQAANKTASVAISNVTNAGDALQAQVRVTNRVGHKFPSGVGFRRAFIEFAVLDANGNALWSSGRTDSMGVIIDSAGAPIAGELWWKQDCSERLDPGGRIHQPHYQVITQQNQAQIYQELVSDPPDGAPVSDVAGLCGPDATPRGKLTTSFLSICAKVKDNRILPQGFLGLPARQQISAALGADDDMAKESGPTAVGNDPDYVSSDPNAVTGGADSIEYRVPLADLNGTPASVVATLYYQATPPFFLQDRFCTSNTADTKRLYYLGGKLNLAGTPADNWKLRVTTSGPVRVP
jgi:hypothetical protein